MRQCQIEERTVKIAEYIIENKCTVREAAKKFEVSKSTVHKDIVERLEKINKQLYLNARKVLDVNKAERHLRGGMATKKKHSILLLEK
ncbi:MAG: sporulation transcriptional regulator SpoIIID [Clostridia bacterium]|nr:sporulation transcriptional regulator SpoIIID [Clostridia bacterium]